MDTKRKSPAPICPHCAESMRLTLTIPDSGALPELHTYYCRECEVMVLRRASRESGGFLSLRSLKKRLLKRQPFPEEGAIHICS